MASAIWKVLAIPRVPEDLFLSGLDGYAVD